ncbi:hypothetical protein Kpho02_38190 [Kitasatospora phosalacinea]|uniref:Uncharacterized protein n=1 Tax=Kitasatospora phosalacinea TaxID=2065 RepID=A0A9W6Q755_9ACTN|nr:hypothetical protein [Kitasatospora phosalacinea]GLW71520.1 hypothetical protein Kpho02_38190 [Kitasatospora phosalacinea]
MSTVTPAQARQRIAPLLGLPAWRLESADRVLAGSEDAALQQALDHLEGRPLTDVLITPGTLATTFDFGGLRLRTFPLHRPDPDGHEYDHWLLWLDGSGDVLVADSRLRIGRDDAPDAPGER